jgi:predicted Zn-dependent protease
MSVIRRSFRVLVPFLLLFATGCATFRGLEYQSSYLLFSPKDEADLGAQWNAEITRDMTIVDDPEAQAWLDRVGALLADHSPQTEQEFRFAFVENPEVNAFAIPGGYCYVNTGLVLFADNEAQVVAVVGHEINHVTRRHGLTRAQRQMGITVLAAAAAIAASAAEEDTAALAALGLGAGSFLAMQQFSQEDESEADRLGVQAMHAAGWDPRAAVAFWDKMREKSEGQSIPFWMERLVSTHPPSQKRSADLQKTIQTLDMDRPLRLDSEEFQALKARFQARADAAKAEAEKAKNGNSLRR